MELHAAHVTTKCSAYGIATCGENLNEIVSMASNLRRNIIATAFVNDFGQGAHVESFSLVALYH